MITEKTTLRQIAMMPEYADIFPKFVFKMELSREEVYDKPLQEAYMNARSVADGLNALKENLAAGRRYPLYPGAGSADEKDSAELLYFPSADPEADRRPFVLVVPGGAYINVWNLTEGWPVALRFNQLGCHAFVLNYRVDIPKLFPRPLEDIAAALRLIGEKTGLLENGYFTCGFSAGANLILNWCLERHGAPVFGLPRPLAVMPVYAPVSWRLGADDGEEDGEDDWLIRNAFGLSAREIAHSDWNIDEQAGDVPPAYIVCCADDELVDPEHSRLLKRAMDEKGIPAVLEMGESGGHGFAVGDDVSTAGWQKRALSFCMKQVK